MVYFLIKIEGNVFICICLIITTELALIMIHFNIHYVYHDFAHRRMEQHLFKCRVKVNLFPGLEK